MVGLFVVLELFTNLVLETVLYAGAAGVSPVALLASVAFWTWLWGPLGLLMATPLTVCLVVLGKHVPGLEFVGTLLADTPALAPEYGYYQRLLARDQSEAADLIERHIKSEPPRSVYDALLLPALNYAERDRLEQRLSADEETAVLDATRELLSDAAESIRRLHPQPPAPPDDPPLPDRASRCACWATRPTAPPTSSRWRCWPICWTICPSASRLSSTRMQASELLSLVQQQAFSVVCLADLPPSAPSKTRYLVKRLRAALPDVRILVGRWAPSALADESTQLLRDAGANLVASTLAGDPDLPGRARGDSADSSPGDSRRARCVAAWPADIGRLCRVSMCRAACALWRRRTTWTCIFLRRTPEIGGSRAVSSSL